MHYYVIVIDMLVIVEINYFCLSSYVCVNIQHLSFFVTGKIIHVQYGRSGSLAPITGYRADKYEWVKLQPGTWAETHFSSSKIVNLNYIRYEDEGYYCCYMYRGDRVVEKYCFKLVVLRKWVQ